MKGFPFFVSFVFVMLMCFSQVAYAKGCSTGDPFPYSAAYDIDECPEDIQSWLDRANSCAHIEGEYYEGMEAERTKELDASFVELQCEYVACDYDDLFLKYEGDLVYTGVLTEYENVLYGSNGVFSCEQESELPPEERTGEHYLEE